MTQSILKYFPFFFVIVAFVFLFIQHTHKPRIFILHSSSRKSDWIISVDKGLNNLFLDKNYLSIRRYYMNIDNNYDLNQIKKENITAEQVIDQWHPDLIIAFGQNAQLAIAKYIGRNDVKIVFGGISKQDYLDLNYENASNVTGVIENLPFTEARDVFSSIFKNKSKIYYLSDKDIISEKRFKEFLSISWHPFTLVKVELISTFDQWKKAVEEANKISDLLIIRRYNKIYRNRQLVPPKDVIAWTIKFSKIPVVGISSHFVNDGGGLAIGPNAQLNGEDIAKVALMVIKKTKTTSLNTPIVNNYSFLPYLRESELRREMPDVYIPSWYVAFAQSENAYFK